MEFLYLDLLKKSRIYSNEMPTFTPANKQFQNIIEFLSIY